MDELPTSNLGKLDKKIADSPYLTFLQETWLIELDGSNQKNALDKPTQ